MPGLAAAEQGAVSLVRRVARALNRRISDLVALLFHHKPKPQPIKYRGIERLLDMLIHYNQVDLSHPDAEHRLLEVFYHKIYKIFAPSEKIENINDQYWTLRAEEIDSVLCANSLRVGPSLILQLTSTGAQKETSSTSLKP
ncbi:Ubiquitin carboxyl-terminal hydrolase 13 [Hordeum vulgare]|nr:Ubiquitin carboxyl-terminal hydrolase 13 [Hordeum vulgare]